MATREISISILRDIYKRMYVIVDPLRLHAKAQLAEVVEGMYLGAIEKYDALPWYKRIFASKPHQAPDAFESDLPRNIDDWKDHHFEIFWSWFNGRSFRFSRALPGHPYSDFLEEEGTLASLQEIIHLEQGEELVTLTEKEYTAIACAITTLSEWDKLVSGNPTT